MLKPITLKISAGDHSSIGQIKKLGVLRVDSWINWDSKIEIELHERTWGEWFGELFDSGKAAAAREAAAEAVERAMTVAGVDQAIVQNIRAQVDRGGEITGTALANQFDLIDKDKRPTVEKGEPAAENKTPSHGDSLDRRTSVAAPASAPEYSVWSRTDIQLTNRRLAEIEAKDKVKWKMTSDRDIAQRMSADATEVAATSRPSSQGGGEITGFMSLDIETPKGKESEYRELKNVQMAWAYREVLASASTTVAIAPIEDIPMDEQIIREQVAENQWVRRGIVSCSDDSIRLLLEAIVEAKAQKPNLKVIVACAEYPDRETLALRVDGCMEQLGLSND